MMGTSVAVTPLQPPFAKGVAIYTFTDDPIPLAISAKDDRKVQAMLSGGTLEGRTVVLEAHEDGKRVWVHLTQ